MIEEIREHFQKELPREGCGIIGVVKGEKKWFPCKNVADNDEDFVICSKDYFKIKQTADIVAIVHSHPYTSNEPSEVDINYCNSLGIPYYIFSYPDMELNILEPKTNYTELYGREYKFGVTDCFEAARDYLVSTTSWDLPKRDAFEDNWYNKKDLDYFSEENMNTWGFYKVDSPQKNDVIIFSVDCLKNNHMGIYINDDIFFHHAINRLSCRESIYPFWSNYITGFYRYKKQC